MDIKDIQNLIKFISKSGVCEVKLEVNDMKITVRNTDYFKAGNATQPMQIQQVPMVSAIPHAEGGELNTIKDFSSEDVTSDDDKYITIKSPMIGTLYRKSAPDKPNLVEVGSMINLGDKLCVIEAMKLFNHIEAEVSGKIVKVLVEDASPVEFDQPLFLVDPS